MPPNWALGIPQTDPGTAFQQGYQNALLQREHQQDRQVQQQQRQQQFEMQQEQMNVQGRERKLTEYHDQIQRGARIVRQLNPTDDASWQNVRAAAAQAGIDVTEVPEHFDPNYVQQLLAADQALQDPNAGYTLGQGDVRIGPNNQVVARGAPQQPRYYPIPPGGRLELDPSYQGSTTDSTGTPAPATGTYQDGDRETINGVPYVRQGGHWVPATNEAPAFRAGPGGAAPGQQNFP